MREQITLSEKVRLDPTRTQEKVLWQLSDLARRLYNQALEDANRYYEENNRYIGVYGLQKWLTKYKRERPEFKFLYSKMAQMVVRRLDANFRSFFALRRNGRADARPPGFRGRKHFFALEYNQSGFEVGDDRITLSFDRSSDINVHYKARPGFYRKEKTIKGAVVVQDGAAGVYFASIIYHTAKPKPANDRAVAFDPGVRALLTGFDGKRIVKYSSKPVTGRIKYFGKQLDRIQAKIDVKSNGSKNKEKLVRVKHNLLRRRNAQVDQVLHSYANHIVKRHGRIVVGDWSKRDTVSRDPKKGRGNRRINRIVQQLPIQKLIGYLSYKGAEVTKVDESQTTRRCYNCGYTRRKSVPLSIRVLECPRCGVSIDRDANAAINIYQRHIAQVTGPPPLPRSGRLGCRPWSYAFDKHTLSKAPRETLASFQRGSPRL